MGGGSIPKGEGEREQGIGEGIMRYEMDESRERIFEVVSSELEVVSSQVMPHSL